MADSNSYPKLQRLDSEVPKNHANASRFYYHFLYKAFIVTIFLVALPFLSSQAPEFITQNLDTPSWELFQIIFVGIAVSYGLFSKRSDDEKEREHSSKFDNAQLYISRLLQVSSVFDDEHESSPVLDDNKVQTWNSQYYRGEPVVMVAKESPAGNEQRAASLQIREKPLYLPVRSLKSRVFEPDTLETTKESDDLAGSLSRSSSSLGSSSKRFSNNADIFMNGEFRGVRPQNLEVEVEKNVVHRSGSKRFSGNGNKSRNGNFGRVSALNLEEEVDEKVVHRSPIPWRSRSGRMVMKEDVDGPSMEDPEITRLQSRSFRSLSSVSSREDSNSPLRNKLSLSPSLPSPRKLSPLPSLSSESQAKSLQDVMRKKSFKKSSPPPAPPPPPPPFLHKPTRMKSNSSVTNYEISSGKELRRSVRSVPMEFSHNERVEAPRRANTESIRAIRPSEPVTKPVKAEESDENIIDEKAERWSEEVVETFFTNRDYTDKLRHEKLPNMSQPAFMEFAKPQKEDSTEKFPAETEEDTETESEDDFFEESLGKEEVINSCQEETADDSVSDGGPDVNKKADEFIAKFREQIRLQRIESIRISTAQHAINRSR